MFSKSGKSFTSHLALAIALLATSPASAETILTAIDGTVTIKGELRGIDETAYRIMTPSGELVVRREFVTCSGDGCPQLETDEAVDDGEVTLTSQDGRVKIDGRLVDVTNTSYIIDTPGGRLTVRREFTICEGASCPSINIESDRFAVTVSGTDGADLVAAIVGDYAAAKDFNLTQQLGGADTLRTLLVGNERGLEISRIAIREMQAAEAIKALIDGDSQFAITRNRITPAVLSAQLGTEISEISEYLNEEIIGLDAVSFVVGATSGIDVISLGDAQSIMNGSIRNWSQLGGADMPIKLHTMADNSGMMDQLRAWGMVNTANLPDAVLHNSVDALNAAINADSSAFGVIYRSQASGVKALNLASACNIFVDNSDFAIQTEEHPLALRWYQYSMKDGGGSEFAQNVSRFIPTDFGQQSIASRGLVTQQLQIVPMQEQGARLLSTVLAGNGDRVSNTVMRNYFNEASNARRISTSLRFLSGNATLDTKAESDIDRISEIVRSSEYEGYEVLVFGFSDSYGTLEANLNLSERRANSVRDLLLNKNPGYLETGTVRSFGIGPIAPVGCNEFAEGREQNRRVEIWIRPRA
ncbi:phosphate ABC transporter substrate-binding/OmpA family protein [Yoonia sp. SDW83-1]|uniref:phosphate ABC transporter substrate-binding/OmpA family protein n=1 Tax=Yoonia sp. SDW83-1 TaxID=3366945 RepID=UPI00398C7749